jgi:L-alanine-DL-glutamate epimerase-like enolase superfamily enzyme
MQITAVRSLLFAAAEDWSFVIVCIDTDEGIVGYGDASLKTGPRQSSVPWSRCVQF